ncbi:MAG: hypothetical protein G01um101433_858 [Parcubacteria group bacterium Gr01-1014_33]|nr:MAG: hypothetical protein G01um101433_858 [Parcubacteria group bacterium Gr01-1014_33]
MGRQNRNWSYSEPVSKGGQKMVKSTVVDRKVLRALVAKKLLVAIDSLVEEHQEVIKLVLEIDQKEARKYLIELAVDACVFILRETKDK